MTNKKYYHYVDLPNWQQVSADILAWITNNTDYTTNKAIRGYVSPDKDRIFAELPQIQTMFDSINSKVYNMAFIFRNNHIYTEPHYDGVKCSARINLPILNCENTHTIFYELKEGAVMQSIHDIRGNRQLNVKFADCYKVDQVELNKPLVLCINELHGIFVPAENALPRISVTFYVDPDPISFII